MSRRTQDGTDQARLFPASPFDGFGPSRFRPPTDPFEGRGVRGRRPARLREGVGPHAPRVPGVYGMMDTRGRVVYVGKAKNLRARLLSYFRESSDPKAGRILEHTRTLVWEHATNEFSALLRELELIQRLRPRFNVLGQPGRQRYCYLALGKGPAPHLYLTKEVTGKELGVYGPLVGRGRLDDAVRRMNDFYRLKDCPSTVKLAFADQVELFPELRAPKCLRLELGTCLGPCAGHCTRAEYGAAARAAKAFLDGRDRSVLADLRGRMDAAARAFEFERAAAARDRLQSFEMIDARLELLRNARKSHSFVYPLADVGGRELWYLIHRGQVRAVVPTPACERTRAETGDLLRATFDAPVPGPDLCPGTVDSVLLVAAWFRKNPAERAKLLARPAAARLCLAAAGIR